MNNRYYEHCPYCDTEYTVLFDEEMEPSYCPACGEEVPEFEEEDYGIDDEGEWETE